MMSGCRSAAAVATRPASEKELVASTTDTVSSSQEESVALAKKNTFLRSWFDRSMRTSRSFKEEPEVVQIRTPPGENDSWGDGINLKEELEASWNESSTSFPQAAPTSSAATSPDHSNSGSLYNDDSSEGTVDSPELSPSRRRKLTKPSALSRNLTPIVEESQRNGLAEKYYDRALTRLSAGGILFAQKEIEQGLKHLDMPRDKETYAKLMALQARTTEKAGDIPSSLRIYIELIQQFRKTKSWKPSADFLSKMYFDCGRLCVELGEYNQAMEFYRLELEATYPDPADVAKVYRKLARAAEEEECDLNQALVLYQQSLLSEEKVWMQSRKEIRRCKHCDPRGNNCPKHIHVSQKARSNMRRVKRNMGRIHAKQQMGESVRMEI